MAEGGGSRTPSERPVADPDADGTAMALAHGFADPAVDTGYVLPHASDTPPALDHQRMLQPDGRPAGDGSMIRPTPQNYVADNPTAPPCLRKNPRWAQRFERNAAFRTVGRWGPKWADRQRSLLLGTASALTFLLVGLMVVPLINGSPSSPSTLLAFYFAKGTANWELIIPSNWPVLFFLGVTGVTNETRKGALYYVDYATPTCEDVFGEACGECSSAGVEVQVAMIMSLVTVFPALLLDLHRIFHYFDLNLSKALAVLFHLLLGVPLAVWAFVAFFMGCVGKVPSDVLHQEKGVGIHFEWENGTLFYTMLVLAIVRPVPGVLHLLVPTPTWAHPEVPLSEAKAHGRPGMEATPAEESTDEEEDRPAPAGPLHASRLSDRQEAAPEPLAPAEGLGGDRIPPLSEMSRQPTYPDPQEATTASNSDSEEFPPMGSTRFDYGAFVSTRGGPYTDRALVQSAAGKSALDIPTKPAAAAFPVSSREEDPPEPADHLEEYHDPNGTMPPSEVSHAGTGDVMSGTGTAPPTPRRFSLDGDVFVDPFADGDTAEAQAAPDAPTAAPEDVDVRLEAAAALLEETVVDAAPPSEGSVQFAMESAGTSVLASRHETEEGPADALGSPAVPPAPAEASIPTRPAQPRPPSTPTPLLAAAFDPTKRMAE